MGAVSDTAPTDDHPPIDPAVLAGLKALGIDADEVPVHPDHPYGHDERGMDLIAERGEES